ncbi:hypothetical protein PAQ31011_01952 [Pandoraea aquatica]|uniref:Uncharacterized protein n=1 Tax=Pandoraea aquatica TaxID=2508290 RepID=A0A5E4UCH7_9BURK|nr:hypothetical protein [Pandoraea aquatica]VVD97252.1 hypothetical protein PAQ31011_01952 [Pandoraea aquatica]
MPSVPPNANFPVMTYPGMDLSAARVSWLVKFNKRLMLEGGPSDSMCREFMENFRHMGMWDAMCDCVTDGLKGRVLSCATRAHLLSFGVGRDFLERNRMLESAAQDVAELLRAIPLHIVEVMFARAEIGDRYAIVVTFPKVPLRMALSAECCSDGHFGLRQELAKALLFHPQEDGASLVEKLAQKLGDDTVPASDAVIWRSWSALLYLCIGSKPIADLFLNRRITFALGMVLRLLASRVCGYPSGDDVRPDRMLEDSKEAFLLAGDGKERWLSVMAIAKLCANSSDNAHAGELMAHAGEKLDNYVKKLIAFEHFSEARNCCEMAIRTYSNLGSASLAEIFLARLDDINAKAPLTDLPFTPLFSNIESVVRRARLAVSPTSDSISSFGGSDWQSTPIKAPWHQPMWRRPFISDASDGCAPMSSDTTG